MENASKALLIAGGVLLSILIISLGVYLFANFGGVTAQIGQNVDESQIAQFNSQFTVNEEKDNVTIYDIVSMANLATQNNKQYGFQKQTPTGNNYYIAVTLQGKGQIEFGAETTNEDYINNYYSENLIIPQVNSINGSTGLTYYDVQVEISPETQRVYHVFCRPK